MMSQITLEQYLALPEEEGTRHEVWRGELIAMPGPNAVHGLIQMAFGIALGTSPDVKAFGAVVGAVACCLSTAPTILYVPDLAVYRWDRLTPEAQVGITPGAPDLAVEIVSPSNDADALEGKVKEYLTFGSHAVIIIFPRAQTVHVRRAGLEAQVFGIQHTLTLPDLFPGWSMPVAEIFAFGKP